MRWRRRPRSRYLRDERGARGGGGLGLPVARAGIPGLLLLVLAVVFGGRLLGGGGLDIPGIEDFPRAPGGGGGIAREADPDARLVDFVSFVLDDVQGMWTRQFERAGEGYRPAQLVVFADATSTGCGSATSAVGPFYCPADQTVYLDLGFFRELRRRFGAPGDFAQAYVIAHEIAHHVQNLLGISDRVHGASQEDRERANELSIRLELQADCLAGVWGFTTKRRGILEAGDLQEGLDAAAAVGDDRVQREATGRIDRESWTHGSSRQRVAWFSRGFQTGEADRCDTFSGGV